MKIRVSLVERHYGYIDIDVPENSPILDPNASLLKKRRAAKKLAEHEITEGGRIPYREPVHRNNKEFPARKTQIIVFLVIEDGIYVLVLAAVCSQLEEEDT